MRTRLISFVVLGNIYYGMWRRSRHVKRYVVWWAGVEVDVGEAGVGGGGMGGEGMGREGMGGANLEVNVGRI